jgi:hypothetical protein
MKHLVGKEIVKKVPFMDDEVEIRKLTVREVLEVQKEINKLSKSKDENSQISIIRELLRKTVKSAEGMTDEDFDAFPLSELTDLVEKAISFSGMGGGAATEGN